MEQNCEFGADEDNCDCNGSKNNTSLKGSSMGTLITWNISKAIEKDPDIDLKVALRAAQERLDSIPHDGTNIISKFPEQRHIACALLAWKELGHEDADSLCEFYQSHRKEEEQSSSNQIESDTVDSPKCSHRFTDYARVNDACKIGPVVKIPTVMSSEMETKLSKGRKVPKNSRPPVRNSINCYQTRLFSEKGLPTKTTVMRLDNDSYSQNEQPNKKKSLDKDLLRKIDEVCCLESSCVNRLAELDSTIKELRKRAAQLARREAERGELLERAEAAWKDLERGYQRRLTLALEKEDDITRQIQKLIIERNGYKDACSKLVNQLQNQGDGAEKIRKKLVEVEKQVCERACTRLQLSEDAARVEAELSHQQCVAMQLERDLQFKEDQARRKLNSLESELEAMMALMVDTERTLRAELGGLGEQMGLVSANLLEEDQRTEALKEEVAKLVKLKNEMSEDLEGCKMTCDKKMQDRVDNLAKKTEELEKLREQTLECRCKFPKDSSVQVKRTPSLAAMCRCTPEDKFLDSCSCTSIRTSLMSNLLADLFGGLQTELGETGLAMPCQMLKCLEDNHNWDRATNVKTNLRAFFSKLLVGELEIAITNSIEKCHARWVGATCADVVRRSIPDFGSVDSERWQEKAMERRAQRLAEQLAEKMFQERAEAIMKEAKDVVQSGRPPCECDQPEDSLKSAPRRKSPNSSVNNRSVFPCLVCEPLITQEKTDDIGTRNSSPSKPKKAILSKISGSSFNKGYVVPNKPLLANEHQPSVNTANMHKACGVDARDRPMGQACNGSAPECLHQTIEDVLELKAAIDDLKKETIKKNDLMVMEKNITKLIQQSTVADDLEITPTMHYTIPSPQEVSSMKETQSSNGNISCPTCSKQVNCDKRKNPNIFPNTVPKNTSKSGNKDKYKGKSGKRAGQSFAVNLCLCGDTKAQKKMYEQAKSIARADLNPEIEKQSKTRVKTKPSKNSERGTNNMCKSDCICINKKPSTSSIEKFLDTLAKWKCDLADSSGNCESRMSKETEIHPPYDGAKHGKNTGLNEIVQSPSNLKTEKKMFKSSDGVTNSTQPESDIIRHPVATTIESEYMGAVNLEKSNETFCRCVIAKEMIQSKVQCLNNMINSDFSIQRLDSCSCCKKYIEKTDLQTSVLKKARMKYSSSSSSEKQNHKSSRVIGDVKKSDDMSSKGKKYNAKPVSNSSRGENVHENVEQLTDEHASAIDQIVKRTELFPGDCDYQIKFLGVTLTNETIKKPEEVLYENHYNNSGHNNPPLAIPMTSVCQTEYWAGVKKPDALGQPKEYNKTEHRTIATNKQLPSCQCNVNFDELKNFFDNTFNKQYGDYTINEDKKIDTSSLKDTGLDTSQPCVCCHNNISKDESQELEANTFHLLEEHLKEKFEKFKETCDVSCFPSEKDKFYSSTLKKIKQLVLDSTNAVICQCDNDNQAGQEVSGSWKRAYDLLQEYLKVKIKRVQCNCASPKPETENIVPNVAEKVCLLIENDFQRLRDFCVSKESKQLPRKTSHASPKKNKDISTKTIANKVKKKGSFVNTDDSFFKRTFSSQISIHNMKPENKSCDAIKKPDETIQTEESDHKMTDKCCLFTSKKEHIFPVIMNHKSTSFQCLIDNEDNYTKKHTQQVFNEEENNKPKFDDQDQVPQDSANKNLGDNVPSFYKNVSLPFIGCTVECSCGNNLTHCVCSKSMVKKNHTAINDIWKSCTKEVNKNTDYIMCNVNKHSDHLCNRHKIGGKKSEFCNTETFAKTEEEEIILKGSYDNLCNKDCTTNTYYNYEDESNIRHPYQFYEYQFPHDMDPESRSVRFPDETLNLQRAISEIGSNSSDNLKDGVQNCDCDLVPICHVKLLMQNIENKLSHFECICDSMDQKVCPIHSKKNECLERY